MKMGRMTTCGSDVPPSTRTARGWTLVCPSMNLHASHRVRRRFSASSPGAFGNSTTSTARGYHAGCDRLTPRPLTVTGGTKPADIPVTALQGSTGCLNLISTTLWLLLPACWALVFVCADQGINRGSVFSKPQWCYFWATANSSKFATSRRLLTWRIP